MSVSMLRPFFISVAGVVVIVLVGFLCGILPESPFLAFIQAEEVNDYLSAIRYRSAASAPAPTHICNVFYYWRRQFGVFAYDVGT